MLPITWVDMPLASEMTKAAAGILFPYNSQDIEELGKICSKRAFTGIYRLLLKFPTIAFLLKQVPKIWKLYHDSGYVTLDDINEQGALLVIHDCADIDEVHLRLVKGYSIQTLETSGAKKVTCTLASSAADEYKMQFNWS